MRSFISALIIAALLAAGSVFYTCRLQAVSEELSEMTNSITTELYSENYTEAAELIEELTTTLRRLEPFLATLGNHDEIDNIEGHISELAVFTESGDKTDALAKSKLLGVLFEHLPKNSLIRPENIL